MSISCSARQAVHRVIFSCCFVFNSMEKILFYSRTHLLVPSQKKHIFHLSMFHTQQNANSSATLCFLNSTVDRIHVYHKHVIKAEICESFVFMFHSI